MHGVGSFDPGRVAKVAVFRALKLGDLLCAVPALRAVRAALPRAEVTLIGLPWAAEFADRFSAYIDRFLPFPGWPGLPERPVDVPAVPRFLAAVQAERFDLAVQLHGSGPVVNPLLELFGARRTAGFHRPGDPCPDPCTYCPWPDRGLETERLLALTDHLGFPRRGEHLEFPLTPADEAAVAGFDLPPGGYAVVHPGASMPERRWPAERFAAVTDTLAGCGLQVVVTGTAGEAPLAAELAARARCEVLDLTGRTDLGATAALLRDARVLVCNDTGVSHVAAGVRCPSVVVSTGDNPARWAPADRRRHRVLCNPAGLVPAADVLAELDALLTTAHTEVPCRSGC